MGEVHSRVVTAEGNGTRGPDGPLSLWVRAFGKLQYLRIASLDEVFQFIGTLKIFVQGAATGVGYVVMASRHLA